MKTLALITPSEVLEVQPVPRAQLSAFNKHMAELQAIWLEEFFSTADAIARDDCWGHMQAIAAMLPHHDAPAICGFKLEKISNDYEQLERLFFGDPSKAYEADQTLTGQLVIADFDLRLFQGCALYELHHFEPKKNDRGLPLEPGKAPGRDIKAEDIPIESSGDPDTDAIAYLIQGFGAQDGLTLWQALDAATIDGLIFVANQLSRPPEDRLDDYLKRCFDKHYEAQGGAGQKLKDLGHKPGQAVIGPNDFNPDDIARIMAKLGPKS